VSGERTRSLLLVALGATAVWLPLSDAALNYIRPALEPYLLLGGVVLLLLGLLPPSGLLARHPPTAPGSEGGAPNLTDQGAGGEDHRHGGIGWLLLVPVLVVVLVQPAALGSYAASARRAVPSGGGSFPPLAAPVRGAVPMTMAEFVTRALRDDSQSLQGVRVRLLGFVAPARRGGGYRLTRFVIFCCAADAEALQVAVQGDNVQRRRDQWLEVEGQWLPRPLPDADDPSPPPPQLQVASVRPIAQPHRPYEYSVQYAG
jgi:uncharacterized repeat protein (TIGR03943 family)